jgi:Na+/H+ antiporter NhaD/arsenite permease-like protein
MVAVLRKLIADKSDRMIYACLTILTANAGGSWSPIGDVTTLLLWTGGNLTVTHQVSHLILSSALYAAIACTIVSFMFPKGENIQDVVLEKSNLPEYITHKYQTTLLLIGLSSLAMVPVFQSLFNLPPFMGVLLGLVILWVITDIKAHKSHDSASKKLLVSNLFSKLDISTVLFFLGILMSVNALKTVGFLTELSLGLNKLIGDPNTISLLLGVCSSFLDNVALVAASIGMYPLAEAGAFMVDGTFWTFLAYCAVTGGSLLIIGSASGVTVMGLEKISFVYYLKKFSWIALLSYAAGAVVYLLLF